MVLASMPNAPCILGDFVGAEMKVVKYKYFSNSLIIHQVRTKKHNRKGGLDTRS